MFCGIAAAWWLAHPLVVHAQPAGIYARASGNCSNAINTGDFAKISIQCTYNELPAEWKRKVDTLARQVGSLTRKASQMEGALHQVSTRVDTIELAEANNNQLVDMRLDALERGLSASTDENRVLKDQLAAVYAMLQTSAQAPDASSQVKAAAAALDEGDAAPAAKLLASQANATAASDKASSSALLLQQAVLLQTKNLEQALDAAQRALALDPANDNARTLAIGLKNAMGDFAGAVELQAKVVELARTRLAAAPNDALSQLELATALGQLGNLHMMRGQFQDAEAQTLESLSLLKALVAREPGNLVWTDTLGAAYAQLSLVLQSTDRPGEALEPQNESLHLAEIMADKFPGPATKFSLISRLQGSGQLQWRLGKTAEAVASFEKALEQIPALIQEFPEVDAGYATHAGILSQMASLQSFAGNNEDAIATLNKAIEIAKGRRQKNPQGTFWVRNAEIFLGARGDAQVSRIAMTSQDFSRFTGEALESYQEAFTIATQLSQAQPNEFVYAQDKWISLSRLARVRLARGEITTAGELLNEGVAILEPLVTKFGHLSFWRAQYGQAKWQLASVRVAQGRTSEAEPLVASSIEELSKAVSADSGNLTLRHDLAIAYFTRAQIAAMSKRDTDCLDDLSRVEEMRKELNAKDPANGVWSSELIMTQMAIGRSPIATKERKLAALQAARALSVTHLSKSLQPAIPQGMVEAIDQIIEALGPMI